MNDWLIEDDVIQCLIRTNDIIDNAEEQKESKREEKQPRNTSILTSKLFDLMTNMTFQSCSAYSTLVTGKYTNP